MTTAPLSRLSAFCGHLIEASWLIAVAVVPVLVDPHAVHGFDPIKMALLRILGLVVAGALVIRAVESCSKVPCAPGFRALAGVPSWAFASVALVAAFLAAGIVSLEPGNSFWGAPQFVQGTFSLICNLALFAGVATHLRSRAQIDRLVVVALAASVPVTIYALIQRAGLNPIEFASEKLAAISFAGHPIYLAGYLLMLMPLCVWRLWQSLELRSAPRLPVQTLAYAGVLLLQFCAFVATEKRGPLVALAIGGACALALLAARQRRFRLAAWGFGMAAALALFLTALAALAKAGVPILETPLLGRLSLIVPLGGGTGDVFRDTLWAEAPALVTAAEPFVFPNGEPDPWRILRPLVGYGPETLQAMLSQVWSFPAAGPGVRLESRFHNGFWDTWQSVGFAGILAFLFFNVCVYAAGCRAIGFPAAGNGELRLGGAALGLGVVCGGATSLVYGPGYFGLGFPLGFIGGLVGTTFWSAFRQSGKEGVAGDRAEWLLVVALLVALLAHLADMAFAFETSAALMLFWIFSGAVVGIEALRRKEAISSAAEESPAEATSWKRAGLLAGVIVGAMLAAAANMFVNAPLRTSSTMGEILFGSLAHLQPDRDAIPPILLLASWAFAVFLIVSTLARERIREAALLGGGLSLAIGVLWAVLKAWWLAATGPIPADSEPVTAVFAIATRLEILGPVLLSLCLGAAFCVAALLSSGNERSLRPPAGVAVWAAAGLTAITIFSAIWFAAIDIPRDGAWNRLGDALNRFGSKAFAVAVYERALERDSSNVPARIFCADALIEIAERSPDPGAFSAAMQAAEGVLLDGIRRSDLNRGNYYLGRLYLRWALRESDEAVKQSLALRARDALLRATRFCPKSEAEWVEASIVDAQLLGDPDSAREKLERADAITSRTVLPAPYIDPTPWGDNYAYQSFSSSAPSLKRFYADRAIRYFDRAIKEEHEAAVEGKRSQRRSEIARENLYETLIAKAKLLISLGDQRASVAPLQDAVEIPTEAGAWEARAILAQVHANLGDRPGALREIAAAIDEAPPEAREELVGIQRRLAASPDSQEESPASR